MIAIIDYGVGNLFSLECSLKKIGESCIISGDVQTIRGADKLILPGVGAFGDAADKLRLSGLDKIILEEAKRGKHILGICLGMQLLFEKSFEYGEHCGLGIVRGQVRPLSEKVANLKIPHMGWNTLKFTRKTKLFDGINNGDYVYFVHSYYGQCADDSLVAVTDYGFDVTAAVQKDNVAGVQFHPEKSGETGLKILKNFADM